MKTIRAAKMTLIGAFAILLMLTALNNVLDYSSNFNFVAHVMSMDSIPTNSLKWRRIHSPVLHHLVYNAITAAELFSGVLCLVGTVKCLRAIRTDGPEFFEAAKPAVIGLLLSNLIWLFGFLTVGGEWFVSWQSTSWNGQGAALRMFVISTLILLFLAQPENGR
jgi:predicted small integral membrane protein